MTDSDMFQTVAAMKKAGKSYRQLAGEIGISAARAHKILKQGYARSAIGRPIVDQPANLEPRPAKTFAGEIPVFIAEHGDRCKLRTAAKKRDLTIQQLIQLVVETVVQENLFNAVLDDGDGR